MTVLWILLAIVYVACWVYFGLATFRKGHYWMFWIGFFLPFLWIIGALIAPTDTPPHAPPPVGAWSAQATSLRPGARRTGRNGDSNGLYTRS